VAGEGLNEVTATGGKDVGRPGQQGAGSAGTLGLRVIRALNVYRIIVAIPSGPADAYHGARSARAAATGVIPHSAGRRPADVNRQAQRQAVDLS